MDIGRHDRPRADLNRRLWLLLTAHQHGLADATRGVVDSGLAIGDSGRVHKARTFRPTTPHRELLRARPLVYFALGARGLRAIASSSNLSIKEDLLLLDASDR